MNTTARPGIMPIPYEWDRGRKIAAALAIATLLIMIIVLASRRQAMTAQFRITAERTALLNEILHERDLARDDRDWLRLENAMLRDRLSELEKKANPAPPP
jgi:hypothetical protein